MSKLNEEQFNALIDYIDNRILEALTYELGRPVTRANELQFGSAFDRVKFELKEQGE